MDTILDNKAKWRTRKDKFGIPDAVCKFSMGDKLEAFEKLAKPIKAGEYAAEVAAWDTIIPVLTTYHTALAALKPAKFTCKASDQAANHKKVKDEIASWLAHAKERRERADSFQKPMVMLSKAFATVFAKFKTIAKGDGTALESFYRKELRNDLGQYVKLAAKLPLGADVLHDLGRYVEFAELVNANLNGPKDFAKAHLDMAKALAVLHPHMH